AAAGPGGAAADRSALRLKGGGRERGGDGGPDGRGAAAVSGLRVPAARERALSRQGRAVCHGRPAVLGRGGRRALAGWGAALLGGRDRTGAGAGGAAQAGVRTPGGAG